MEKITYEQIISWKPCYDPISIGMSKDWEGTLLEWIEEFRDRVEKPEDILWVSLRKECMSHKQMGIFALWCAREALKLVENPDARSIRACDMAEKYISGQATRKELDAAIVDASAAKEAAEAYAYAAADNAAAAYAATSNAAYYAANVPVADYEAAGPDYDPDDPDYEADEADYNAATYTLAAAYAASKEITTQQQVDKLIEILSEKPV